MKNHSVLISPLLCLLCLSASVALSGCGSGSGNRAINNVPTGGAGSIELPVNPVPDNPTPGDPLPPAQQITGSLAFENATGTVVTSPFTPTTGEAELPVSTPGVPNTGVPSEFTFETSDPVVGPDGVTLTKRKLVLALPSGFVAGSVIKLGTVSSITLYNVTYTETRSGEGVQSYDVSRRYRTALGTDGGTVTLVSTDNNIYTFDIDVALKGDDGNTTGKGTFNLRGRISIYVPKSSSPLFY